MERYFMRRVRAVAYLLDCRRGWLKITASPNGDIAFEADQIELIDQLIRDVRAGRVRTFELAHPRAISIYVS
jgi:hypothetical protein